jgi:hypothetical protein
LAYWFHLLGEDYTSLKPISQEGFFIFRTFNVYFGD